MAEQAAEQNKRAKEKTRPDNLKHISRTSNEAPKFNIPLINFNSNQNSETKNIANLVKLKQLHEKYETFVDKKMIEKILKDKK